MKTSQWTKGPARRRLLGHCSALAAFACGAWPLPVQAASGNHAHTVLVLGDSLSAEYGLTVGQGWVALLTRRLQQEKLSAQVMNASISGDTTSGGRSRLPALLSRHQPSIVIIELGGNDALRGLALPQVRENLTQMVRSSRQSGAAVLLLGIAVPPNYGRAYSDGFSRLFAEVAQAEGAALVPFLLKGVADVPASASFFQVDRIHPNAQAQPLMLGNVWPALQPLLRPARR